MENSFPQGGTLVLSQWIFKLHNDPERPQRYPVVARNVYLSHPAFGGAISIHSTGPKETERQIDCGAIPGCVGRPVFP
jgi:hypothetical protein